ncbi:hypothetical protein MKZ38_005844 [Zalerion maritima]|uniref:Uncharacterized protein n=1 Tax=Zalerion maritima TaxID=339359 RepID=A0AAD5WP20_9PEZI|nr:hypothetical protein MKZ38_005844 [Zalerion maritima]
MNSASLLALERHWEQSSTFLEDSVKLLPLVSPRLLEQTDKQDMLTEFAGLASMAAATALEAHKEPYHALRPLELGRGIIAGLLMEMRGDVSDRGPLTDLRQRCLVLEDIREQPGFQYFLELPTVDEVKPAANPNLIAVINVTSRRCVALLIEHGQIWVNGTINYDYGG